MAPAPAVKRGVEIDANIAVAELSDQYDMLRSRLFMFRQEIAKRDVVIQQQAARIVVLEAQLPTKGNKPGGSPPGTGRGSTKK